MQRKNKMKKISILIFISIILSLTGCRTTKPNSFSDEEYIWEDWSVSTNRIEIINVSLP